MTSGPELNANTETFYDEESPLLERASALPPSKSSWRRRLDQHVVILCFILIILLEIGVYLQLAPLNELVEQIICRDYLAEHKERGMLGLQDPRCKNAEVQGKLAMLRGWQSTFDCIPGKPVILSLCFNVSLKAFTDILIGMLTAIPYGLMSDTYGRRVVLVMSLFGVMLGVIWYDIVCR